MSKQLLMICVGILSVSLPVGATPLDTYSFKTSSATDGGTALRLLSIAGAPADDPALDAAGGKHLSTLPAPSSVSPGMRSASILMTAAMKPPVASATDTGGTPYDDGGETRVVAVPEPSVAWLMLAGLAGFFFRRR